ncbi:hypothetical protein OPT61_g2188 [Boeremia exigua]|uniref:Uncharacterized protein n=1 Tax=Boeremia exigua TaxID=749465 RepID=A0ACC2IMN8_9PLEO|nr:hypothetical protein OPT61_g2188 [Boeremia exigua]
MSTGRSGCDKLDDSRPGWTDYRECKLKQYGTCFLEMNARQLQDVAVNNDADSPASSPVRRPQGPSVAAPPSVTQSMTLEPALAVRFETRGAVPTLSLFSKSVPQVAN